MWQQLIRKVGFRDREWGDWHTPDDAETPRYRALADLRLRFAPNAPLLDLGCGTAPLLKHLPADLLYLGIDCQPEAAKIGQAACRPHQRVLCGNVANHTLHKTFPFGCVVFSEVLYYQPTTKAALALIESYAKAIQPPAIALVSIWTEGTRLPKNAATLEAVRTQYRDRLLTDEYLAASFNRGWHLVALHL